MYVLNKLYLLVTENYDKLFISLPTYPCGEALSNHFVVHVQYLRHGRIYSFYIVVLGRAKGCLLLAHIEEIHDMYELKLALKMCAI